MHPDRSGQFWLLPRDSDAQHQRVATVAAPRGRGSLLIASLPALLENRVRIGSVVRVDIPGKPPQDGICIDISESAWDQSRPHISEVLIDETLISPALVRLGQWISDYYVCTAGCVYAAMLPARLRTPRNIRVRWLRATQIGHPDKATPSQAALLAALAAGARRRREVIAECGAISATISSLRKRGLIESYETTEPAPPRVNRAAASEADLTFDPNSAEDRFELTIDQTAALEAIGSAIHSDPAAFAAFVLFGIPGSGKTEVYVRAIREVIGRGGQAILLVPEIALATQVVARLARRFERVAILHSRLTARARMDTLRAIAAGGADLVIGTRTAVFAPCARLGLIVVDEEQETSFKNQAAPRFHARDVALIRAQQAGIPILLGSATPSLETWHNAHTLPHYRLLRLGRRVPGAQLPRVEVVSRDSREEGGASALMHERLVTLLRDTLSGGRQAVILHNRRGYARALQCERCGLKPTCERCLAPLVFHEIDRSLRCHRCGSHAPAPRECPNSSCGGRMLRLGVGIQRIYEELSRIVPAARVLRVDSDTLKHRRDYAEALRRVESREVDILLGTQIVAKGLDFPAVGLVAVIDADASLWLPDFRAAERTFQLLMQVIGRAGRREGESIAFLQASAPQSSAVRHAIALDYESFAAHELIGRERWRYPPFGRLARIVLADDRPRRAAAAAEKLSADLGRIAARVSAAIDVGPGEPCAIARHRDRLRYQVLIRAPRDGSLQQLLARAGQERRLRRGVQRQLVDIDPIELL
ncbi:MAG: primosomal protein N' [Phycisphaerales bacterium]|nr:primosomal protein N' [Phycisphaerales bacterium]